MKSLSKYFIGQRLVTTVLFCASFALSAASGVTTFIGMQDYSGFLLVSAGVTFGVQCLLFAISWWLGENWRRGFGYVASGLLIFATCAFVSIFFSFASLYATIDNGRGDHAAQQRMEDLVSELEQKLKVKLDARLQQAGFEMINGPEVSTWANNVTSVLDASRSATEQLQNAARQKQTKLQETLIEQQRQLRIVEKDIEILEIGNQNFFDQLSKAQQRLAQAQAESQRLEDAVSQLRGSIAGDKVRREEEASDGGCGVQCRRIEGEIKDKERDLAGLIGQLELAKETELDRSQDVQLMGHDNQTAADLDALKEKKTLLETQIAENNTLMTSDGVQLPENVNNTAEAVRKRLTEFKTLDLDAFEEIIDGCTSLRLQLVEAGLSGPEITAECAGTQVVPRLNEVRSIAERQKNLNRGCDTSTLFLDELSFEKLRSFGDVCIASAGFLDDETRELKNSLFRMEQTRGTQAHNFAKVQAALMDDNDPLAKLALMLAIAIDLLVLLCALIGTNVGVSETARAIQYFLSNKRPDQERKAMHIVDQPNGRQALILFEKGADWLTARGYGGYELDPDTGERSFVFPETAIPAMQNEILLGNDEDSTSPPPPSNNRPGPRVVRKLSRGS